MDYTIENEVLKVDVSTAGAELRSIFHKESEREYLWQGSPDWWPRRAPVLFPIVGKLNNNQYRLDGKTYPMSQHGFARDCEFELQREDPATLRFVLRSDNDLLEKFPFPFELAITYRLTGSKVSVQYEVTNTGSDTMCFSIGGHPGFALAPGEVLADYDVQFELKERLDRHLLEEGLFNGKTQKVLSDANLLRLGDQVVADDALVFKRPRSGWIRLKSRKSRYNLKFGIEEFPYLGIWSKPGASFVCLEAWSGLADKRGFTSDFKQKEGVQQLGPGGLFDREFWIEIEGDVVQVQPQAEGQRQAQGQKNQGSRSSNRRGGQRPQR